MSKIYVISDTHFGHANIINFCNRPFANVDVMDECLVDNWNSTVSDQDIVYHLGDVAFSGAKEILPRLKGKKRLVLGNHDNPKSPTLLNTFQKIMLWRPFPEYGVILSHMPLLDRGLGGGKTYRELINIHGHIHHKASPSDGHINVSVEWTDYRPLELEKVLDLHRKSKNVE